MRRCLKRPHVDSSFRENVFRSGRSDTRNRRQEFLGPVELVFRDERVDQVGECVDLKVDHVEPVKVQANEFAVVVGEVAVEGKP